MQLSRDFSATKTCPNKRNTRGGRSSQESYSSRSSDVKIYSSTSRSNRFKSNLQPSEVKVKLTGSKYAQVSN